MKCIEVVENRTGKLLARFPVTVPQPVDVIFTKDRSTKQKYLTIRTKSSDPFDKTKRQDFPVQWNQYSEISLREVELSL